MKKIIVLTGLLWSTAHGIHLSLNTSQKIDFTTKRISIIEKNIDQKVREKANLEHALAAATQAKDTGTLALLQAKLLTLATDLKELHENKTIAKNSIQSLIPQQ